MLGERIALLRRGMGWSQSALARVLHISPSAVGMYEQGRREPSLELLLMLAREFGVSADYLLTGRPMNRQDQRVMEQAFRENLRTTQTDRLSREELAALTAVVLTES